MKLLLINLLQPQQTRLSWVVIVAAALVLIAGVSLLMYFYRRYKRIEKETEDEWDGSRSSLFVKAPREQVDTAKSTHSIETSAPVADETPVVGGATRQFVSEVEAPPAMPPKAIPPEPVTEPIQSADSPVQRGTELLASPAPVVPISKPEAAANAEPFDEEVWAGLDAGEPPSVVPEHAPESEPVRVTRVESPSHLEPFEAPKIEHRQPREPYEPPRIEPLTPKDQAATRALHSMKSPAIEPTKQRAADRHTELLGASQPLVASPSEPDRQTLEFAAASVTPSRKDAEPPIASGSAYKSRLAPAGSILGLPFESSSRPLILGKPARPDEETGIGALTNYGKDLGPKGGHAGTVVLLLVLALLGGGVAAYVFVPSVHSRTNALVARIRGVDAKSIEAASGPRAQIIPSFRPEVNKNMVIARGAVDNISDGPLENLEVEVALQRGDDTEVRRIAVTPSPLPPNERGNFEFEYDGKRDSGFAGYKITRLFSNGNEVKFKSPQK